MGRRPQLSRSRISICLGPKSSWLILSSHFQLSNPEQNRLMQSLFVCPSCAMRGDSQSGSRRFPFNLLLSPESCLESLQRNSDACLQPNPLAFGEARVTRLPGDSSLQSFRSEPLRANCRWGWHSRWTGTASTIRDCNPTDPKPVSMASQEEFLPGLSKREQLFVFIARRLHL